MSRVAAFVLFAVLGCSRSGEPSSAPDASAPSLVAEHGAASLVAELRKRPEFATQLPVTAHLDRRVSGFALDRGATKFRPVGDELESTLPTRADAPVHIAVRGDEDLWIETLPGGTLPVEGEVVAGAVVYQSAGSQLDLVHAATPRAVEELRVLRGTAAPTSLSWRITRGPHVSAVRLGAGGRVEIVDQHGRVRIVGESLFAIDAKGKRQNLSAKLEGDVLSAALDVHDLTYPITVDPKWTATGSMSAARSEPAIVAMPSGKVLVVGGSTGIATLSTAEIFDRTLGTNGGFTAAKSMSTVHPGAKGVLLSDGRVMVANTFLATPEAAEIYNPATDTWTSTGVIGSPSRYYGLLAPLPSGSALYAFGSDGLTSNGKTYYYAPSTNTWVAAGDGLARGNGAAMVALSTGKVLAVGGGTTTAQLYDPVAKTWSSAGTTAGVGAWAAALPTGKVLVASGLTMQTYDPVAASWATLGSVPVNPIAIVPLLAGKVLSFEVGGAASLYDTGTSARTVTASVPGGRDARGVLLQTGEVLIAGGSSEGTDSGGEPITIVHSNADLFSVGDIGESCVTVSDCTKAAGCVDGVCCGSATCSGQCQACDGVGTKGTCANITDAPHGGRTACTAPYLVCKAGACATSCTSDSDCVATGYCTTGGSCAFKKAAAATCVANKECTSNNCVDGVCCNSSCTGKCEACDVAGSVGTCSPVPSGQPHGTRTPCSGSGLCAAQCNGSSRTACGSLPTSTTVCVAASCGAGTETWQSNCDGFGNCPTPTMKLCGAYGCGATTCKTTCTGVSDCASGYFCSGSSCVTTGGLGTVCSAPSDCTSGNCVDSTCCSTPSCASPLKCSANGLGTCSKPLGTSCSTGTECGSGKCVDGVCCNSTCNGQCEACDVGGSLGTCSPVVGAVHGSRVQCLGAGACKGKCDGSDRTACKSFPAAETVCASASCSSLTETSDARCNGAGSCNAPTTKSCGAYACGATSCKTTCSGAGDCASGYFCSGTTCTTTGALGTACTSSTQCTSGNCVDGVCCSTASCASPLKCNANGSGSCSKPIAAACSSNAECGSGACADGVCCNNACTGQCEACDIGGSVGTCSPVVGAVHVTGGTARTACAGTDACRGKCDGSDRTACKSFPAAETICAAASCTAGIETSDARCNGAGGCGTTTNKSCGTYACGGASCKTSCTTSADCGSGYVCKDFVCKTAGGLGTICDLTSDCSAGSFCTAGEGTTKVCCSVAACGTGEYCAGVSLGAAKGTCLKGNGATCTGGAQCASGFCVDSVCCESACDGQCEACDGSGSAGKCVGIKGAPHGARTTCSDGGTDPCRALTCDGSDRLKCAAFKSGIDVECVAASCKSGVGTEAGYCDGAGKCKAGSTKPCTPFVCGDKGCLTTCAKDADCTTGNVCDTASGQCVAARSSCSPDGLSAIPADKSAPKACSPYLCDTVNGDCFTACTKTEQCQTGFACDGSVCKPSASAEPEADSGCAVSQVGAGESAFGLAFVAALVALARRRRHAD